MTAKVTELCCAEGAVVSLCVLPTQAHTLTAVLHNELLQVRGLQHVGRGERVMEGARRARAHTRTSTLSLQVLAAMLILVLFCSPSGCCQCKGSGAGALDWVALSDD